MGKFFAILFVLAVLYLALGLLVEILFLKREDKRLALDQQALIRIATWPKRLKDM